MMNQFGQKRKRIPKRMRPDGPCAACGQPRGIHIHHANWDPGDNASTILMALCEWCHVQANSLGVPGFKELLWRVSINPQWKAALRKSSDDFYEKLPPHRKTKDVAGNTEAGQVRLLWSESGSSCHDAKLR